MDILQDDAPRAALDWRNAGIGGALATVIETWGSAPRPVGSQLAVSGAAGLVGSVSGGCVEGAVVAEALEVMQTGIARVLEFGVSDDEAFAVGLACGGRIRVLVEPVTEALTAVVQARAANRPVAYLVNIDTGATTTATPGTAREGLAERFRMDRSGFEADGVTFVTIHNPPLRIAVIGGVHIAQALVPMARAAGYAVTVIDPREAFASAARFPDTVLIHEWPDAALAAYAPDARTAVVTLTHDPKLDDPAILTALHSEAFYIGCLGSSRTHAKRLDRLAQAGVAGADLARLYGPAGLDIGARTPAEIAISVLAELTHVLRRG
jgi:xanthine dehydrogenase accessory factor